MTYKRCKTCDRPISQGRSVRCRPCAMDRLGDERAAANTELNTRIRDRLLDVTAENREQDALDDVCLQFQISHSSTARRMKRSGEAALASLLWSRERYWRPLGGWQACVDADARAAVAAWVAE